MKKRIVLCADDYGQAPAISQGIIALIKYGRLSATSCLVTSPYWLESAKWLKPFGFSVDVGLHLNLTEGKALSRSFIDHYGEDLFALPSLLCRALTRQLRQDVIIAEFEAQLDRFIEGFGEAPCFIDGHQHIHQFPVIRDALIVVYKKRLDVEMPYVRWVNEKVSFSDFLFNFKKLIIISTGKHQFRQLLDNNQIPYNSSFAGIYPFGSAANHYREWFLKFLQASEDGGMIMCHPALSGDEQSDPIARARYLEYQYLFGNQFLQDCYVNSVALMPKERVAE